MPAAAEAAASRRESGSGRLEDFRESTKSSSPKVRRKRVTKEELQGA